MVCRFGDGTQRRVDSCVASYDSVLAVDDDPSALAVYRAYFESIGVTRYLEAHSGIRALELLKQERQPVDLVQIDIYMPEMDGIELLRLLHELGYTGSVVIASGARPFDRSSAVNLASTYQLDIIGEITKPLSRDRLDAIYCPQKHQPFLEAPFQPAPAAS